MNADFKAWAEKHIQGIKWGVGGDPAQGLGVCPFHQDKEPSLSINTDNGYWHCFAGCGKGCFRDLAQRLNVEPPGGDRDPSKMGQQSKVKGNIQNKPEKGRTPYNYTNEQGKLL